MPNSCTIIISHFESEAFLHTCIRRIRHFENPQIKQHIFIADQSSDETYNRIIEHYPPFLSKDVTVVRMKPLYSGYGIDVIMREFDIKTDYVCQVHTDIVPISFSWLLLPITLIEENNFSFVGQLQFYTKPTDTIYPPNPFFSMAQCFNVARTETYRELSLQAGFTRFHNRPQSGLTFLNDDWDAWASDDYANKGSDDDVVAFAWQDRYKTDNKLGLAITSYIQPAWGRIIEGLVFHFGSCREAAGVMDRMPGLYQHYTKKINDNYDDALVEELVNLAKANSVDIDNAPRILTRNFWDGKLKVSSPTSDKLNEKIEKLKQ